MTTTKIIELGDNVIQYDGMCYCACKYTRDKDTKEYKLDKDGNRTVSNYSYHASLVQALNRVYERTQKENFELLNCEGNTPRTFQELLGTINKHDDVFKALIRESLKK